MSLVLASCCGGPSVGPLPTNITPWMNLTICCGLLLLSEAGLLLWQLRHVGTPKPWRHLRVHLPTTLGVVALGVAALEWQTLRALSATQPDAWHLAFQQPVPGDWFDQMNAAFGFALVSTGLTMLVTIVALAVGVLYVVVESTGTSKHKGIVARHPTAKP